MTDPEAEVLNRIKSLGGPVRAENLSDSEADALRTLVIRGYVERGVVYENQNIHNRVEVYAVTDLGHIALSDHEQALEKQRQQVADQEAQREIDRIQAESMASQARHSALVSAVIGGIVGSAFTLISDHAPEILGLVHRLLGLGG